MERRIAVTGAAGFVGSRLVSDLAARGWRVAALTSQPDRVPNQGGVETIPCAWDPVVLEGLLRRIEPVSIWVHAAARVDFGDGNLLALYRSNALLSDVLAHHVSAGSTVSRLVYVSTLGVFAKEQSLSDPDGPRPSSHYGLSKLLGERTSLAHLGHRALVLRLHGVWGSGGNLRLYINRCLGEAARGAPPRLRGTGEGRRNFIWVGDLARTIEFALEEGWTGIRPVGSRDLLSTREMVEQIAAAFGVPVVHEADDRPDPDRVVSVPERLPTTPFPEALRLEGPRAR